MISALEIINIRRPFNITYMIFYISGHNITSDSSSLAISNKHILVPRSASFLLLYRNPKELASKVCLFFLYHKFMNSTENFVLTEYLWN